MKHGSIAETRITKVDSECPACRAKITVRVGRKSTCREVTCAACHAVFDYSCWLLGHRQAKGAVAPTTFHQIDFVRKDKKDE